MNRYDFRLLIRQKMKEKNITQEKLANELNCTQGMLSKMIKGVREGKSIIYSEHGKAVFRRLLDIELDTIGEIEETKYTVRKPSESLKKFIGFFESHAFITDRNMPEVQFFEGFEEVFNAVKYYTDDFIERFELSYDAGRNPMDYTDGLYIYFAADNVFCVRNVGRVDRLWEMDLFDDSDYIPFNNDCNLEIRSVNHLKALQKNALILKDELTGRIPAGDSVVLLERIYSNTYNGLLYKKGKKIGKVQIDNYKKGMNPVIVAKYRNREILIPEDNMVFPDKDFIEFCGLNLDLFLATHKMAWDKWFYQEDLEIEDIDLPEKEKNIYTLAVKTINNSRRAYIGKDDEYVSLESCVERLVNDIKEGKAVVVWLAEIGLIVNILKRLGLDYDILNTYNAHDEYMKLRKNF